MSSPLRGAAAVVGIGQTPYYKRATSPDSEVKLAMRAIDAACSDAGISTKDIDEGIARAQQLGIAEADPAYDVDGWDSAVKLCAIANVQIEGLDQGKIGSYLFSKHHIFTTPIVHEEFQGLRITPNLYTTLTELDRFCEVMAEVARKGLPAA